MRRLKVEVTAEDIAAGVPSDCQECPIALALKRAGVIEPAVAKTWFLAGKGADMVNLPPLGWSFVIEFDNGRKVEPFSFEIDVPNEAVRP